MVRLMGRLWNIRVKFTHLPKAELTPHMRYLVEDAERFLAITDNKCG